MTEGLPNSFLYEHCDVPDGESLATWKQHRTPDPRRRAQITGGFVAAFATLAPLLLSVRGSRHR
jgi:hypothetical protein